MSKKATSKPRKSNIHYTVISVFHESKHEELSRKMERVILRDIHLNHK